MQGIRWNLGDGRKVNFWWDCWALEDNPLIFYAQQPLPVELINSTVSKCVNGDGSWNWGLFANLLPNNVILRIAAIKPPLNNCGRDEIRWAHSKTWLFTVKSAYLSLIQQQSALDDPGWKIIWKWQGPQRIKMFLWLAVQNKLKTKAELARRHIPINSNCDICGYQLEDTLHVLRDCSMATRIWRSLLPNENTVSFFSLNLH